MKRKLSNFFGQTPVKGALIGLTIAALSSAMLGGLFKIFDNAAANTTTSGIADIQASDLAKNPNTPPLTFDRKEIGDIEFNPVNEIHPYSVFLAFYARDNAIETPKEAKDALRKEVVEESIKLKDPALTNYLEETASWKSAARAGYSFGMFAEYNQYAEITGFDLSKYPQANAMLQAKAARQLETDISGM